MALFPSRVGCPRPPGAEVLRALSRPFSQEAEFLPIVGPLGCLPSPSLCLPGHLYPPKPLHGPQMVISNILWHISFPHCAISHPCEVGKDVKGWALEPQFGDGEAKAQVLSDLPRVTQQVSDAVGTRTRISQACTAVG